MKQTARVLVGVIALVLLISGTVAAEPRTSFVDLRLRLFSRDLEAHDTDRLWLHMDIDYVEEQLMVMDAANEPLTAELLDQILFGGMAMFDDWDSRIVSVGHIVSVRFDNVEESPWGALVAYFVATTVSGREARFALFVSSTTGLFFGALG